ncbi:hypothetical protein CBR_g38814 [Chara braunii]|uniref:Uncharacterized protein n=1 Tax=Chara braunii TaxID=69332 RepID=A0A388LQR2_CHABU|nr:hypothetical protein CBR_g38814 [Chara braunii]|eukprot:GBG84532.1 hypothetical protein CBR_g38814 [Chara braunii]
MERGVHGTWAARTRNMECMECMERVKSTACNVEYGVNGTCKVDCMQNAERGVHGTCEVDCMECGMWSEWNVQSGLHGTWNVEWMERGMWSAWNW